MHRLASCVTASTPCPRKNAFPTLAAHSADGVLGEILQRPRPPRCAKDWLRSKQYRATIIYCSTHQHPRNKKPCWRLYSRQVSPVTGVVTLCRFSMDRSGSTSMYCSGRSLSRTPLGWSVMFIVQKRRECLSRARQEANILLFLQSLS